MKRFTIAVAILTAVAPTMLLGSEYHKGGQDTDGIYIVVGADWVGPIRGGPKISRCDGTASTGGDQVELQKAADAAEAGGPATGGGGVLVLGTLHLSPKVGETAWSGSGHITDANTLVVDTWDGSYSISDVNVGELIRIYDNPGVGGTDVATAEDDVVATVTVASGSNIDIDGPSFANTYGETDHVLFRRIVPCVVLPPGVSIRGVRPEVSRIAMMGNVAAGEYAIVLTEVAADGAGNFAFEISDLDLWGTKGINANSAVTHGFIANSFGVECSLRDVGIWNCPGTGLVVNEGHGFRWYGCSWAEGNEEHGIVLNGVHACITDVKATSNHRCNVLMKDCKLTNYRGRIDATVADSVGIKIMESSTCNVTGTNFSVSGNNAIGVWITYGARYNAISGCSFYSHTGTGIEIFNLASHGNTISGGAINNAVTLANWVGGSPGTKEANTVTNIAGLPVGQELKFIQALNSSGATIARRLLVARDATAGDFDEMVLLASSGDKLVLGITHVTNPCADGAYGFVQTKGYTTFFPVLDPTNAIAVGDFLGLSGTAGQGEAIGTGEDGGAGYAIAIAYEARGAAAGATYLNALLLEHPVYVP